MLEDNARTLLQTYGQEVDSWRSHGQEAIDQVILPWFEEQQFNGTLPSIEATLVEPLFHYSTHTLEVTDEVLHPWPRTILREMEPVSPHRQKPFEDITPSFANFVENRGLSEATRSYSSYTNLENWIGQLHLHWENQQWQLLFYRRPQITTGWAAFVGAGPSIWRSWRTTLDNVDLYAIHPKVFVDLSEQVLSGQADLLIQKQVTHTLNFWQQNKDWIFENFGPQKKQ